MKNPIYAYEISFTEKNYEKSQQLFDTWKSKKTFLSKIHYIKTKTKTDIHKLLFDEVSQSKPLFICKSIKLFVGKEKSFHMLLYKLKVSMGSINLNSQQSKQVYKKWRFQFSIGRIVTRFNKNYICYEQHKWKKNKWVNMMNVRERNIPTWKKICMKYPIN